MRDSTAIGCAEVPFRQTNEWDARPGYAVGYDVAADQLRNCLDVVAESVTTSGPLLRAVASLRRRAN